MAKHYTLAVIIIKRILIILVLLTSCAIILMPVILKNHDRLQITQMNQEDPIIKLTNQINHPELHGQDQKGRPYTITAEIGSKLDENTIELLKIQGKLKIGDNRYYTLSAHRGHSQQNSKEIYLYGDVTLTNPEQYQAQTQSMLMNHGESSAITYEPIYIKGRDMLLNAENFQMLPGGNILIFKGNVRMVLQ